MNPIPELTLQFALSFPGNNSSDRLVRDSESDDPVSNRFVHTTNGSFFHPDALHVSDLDDVWRPIHCDTAGLAVEMKCSWR